MIMDKTTENQIALLITMLDRLDVNKRHEIFRMVSEQFCLVCGRKRTALMGHAVHGEIVCYHSGE
jgi:hypothetical protein